VRPAAIIDALRSNTIVRISAFVAFADVRRRFTGPVRRRRFTSPSEVAAQRERDRELKPTADSVDARDAPWSVACWCS